MTPSPLGTPTTVSNPKDPNAVKKLAPPPMAALAVKEFEAKPKQVKHTRIPKTLDNSSDEYLKVCLYGETGTGKTLALAHLLELGLTVLSVTADVGGDGYGSVRQHLRSIGKPELLKNCFFFEFQTYDDADEFVFNPSGFWPDIYNHDIDVFFFDGFSGFQLCHVSNKVLGMTSAIKSVGEARQEGLFATEQDWGATKNATISVLDKSLRLYNEKTGKPWHKVYTCLETDKAKDNKGEIKTGPMIQGASSKLMEPAFDLLFRCRKKRVGDGAEKKLTYFYEMEGHSDRIITKSRGLTFNTVEPGDFKALWTSACKQRELPLGKR